MTEEHREHSADRRDPARLGRRASDRPLGDNGDIAHSIRRSLKVLIATTAVLGAVLVALAVKTYVDNSNTTHALCALKNDIRIRVRASVKFVADHPRGAFGIPVVVILKQIRDQQSTLRALDGLDC